ncbi:hypothetical protein [Actinomadura oligospora]|uniref:hypothetical protein n=1 Tax=Actinomadura oligospora TaxID=111804 RepID=UPI000478DF7A|nr:hypothetical protein [Actinomadura oligospora]
MREEEFEDAPTGPLPRVLPGAGRPVVDGVMPPPRQGPDVASARGEVSGEPERDVRHDAAGSGEAVADLEFETGGFSLRSEAVAMTGVVGVLLLGLVVALLWR